MNFNDDKNTNSNISNKKRNRNYSNIEKNLNDFLDDDLDKYFDEFEPKKKKLNTHDDLKCHNILCDHIKYKNYKKWNNNNDIKMTSVNDLSDLIKLAEHYHCKMRKYFNGIDLELLFAIKDDLNELNKMIGLKNIKEDVVNLIIHLLLLKSKEIIKHDRTNFDEQCEQCEQVVIKKNNQDMLHCVITGSAGCGKTTFIEIYAKILTKIGICKSGHIVKVKRTDLIAKYLGQTASLTQQKIDEAKGGILLIDEAYSLGNNEKKDTYSKECLDTLNQALSENKQDFICVIAGYNDALENSFFAYNEGLKRRFPFKFNIQEYTSKELTLILNKKIVEYGEYHIEFKFNEMEKIIEKNFSNFLNQGGDMETIFSYIKINHNKRVFLLSVNEKNKLLISDIEMSVDKFIKSNNLNNEKKIPSYLSHLYI